MGAHGIPGLAVLASAVFLLPGGAAAQDLPGGQEQRPDSSVFEYAREVFFYPQNAGRDPFLSLAAGRESGPRFEEVRLVGIIFSPNPGLSLAVLGPRGSGEGGGGGQEGSARTFRVRRGTTLGNFRILEIQPTRVVVEVVEFGLTEQRIMELRRPGEGGLE